MGSCSQRRPVAIRALGEVEQANRPAICGPNQLIHIGWRTLVGSDMTPDSSKWGLDDCVGHDSDGLDVGASTESPAERVYLGLDLPLQLLGPTTQPHRPAAIDEILSPVEQQQAGLVR